MPAVKTVSSPALDRIRDIAYRLWLEAGQPHGQDEAHWFAAEQLANDEASSATPKPRKAPARKKAA